MTSREKSIDFYMIVVSAVKIMRYDAKIITFEMVSGRNYRGISGFFRQNAGAFQHEFLPFAGGPTARNMTEHWYVFETRERRKRRAVTAASGAGRT